jgi:23S rRNA (cytosine1962-C5)-methyltransferase
MRRPCHHPGMSDLELLDCGDGRRLERFGALVVDRVAPGASQPRRLPPGDWGDAALRWAGGRWARGANLEPWTVGVDGLALECRPAAGGQVGVFPEHAQTWGWLSGAVAAAASTLGRPPEVVSLFGYTGGATLACARAGARVAHVDASRPALSWARRNAGLSGLADRSIRWLPDDVRAFVRRERRRGRRYDAVVLDPPSYGHGTGTWRIDDDLPALLDDLAALLGPSPAFVLLTSHTPGFDGERLGALVRDRLNVPADGGSLDLVARSGAVLRLGAWARSRAR